MKLSRTWALTNIVLRAHILNPFWLSRDARRERRCKIAGSAIPKYLMRYLPKPGSVPEVQPVNNDKNEKIFTIWEISGEGEDTEEGIRTQLVGKVP